MTDNEKTIANEISTSERPRMIQDLRDKIQRLHPEMHRDTVEAMAAKMMLEVQKENMGIIKKVKEEETDKNTEEILEIYNTVGIPTELVTLTDNVSDHAFEGMLNEYDLQPVFVGNEKKNKKSKEVYVYANILKIMENTPTVAYPSLDEFDKEVFHAVLSLYTGGMIAISYEQIARFLSQKKNKRTESKILEDIEISLDKLTSYRVRIDVFNEAIAYNISMPNDRGEFVDTILSGRICKFILNGHKTGGIILHATPIFYDYVIWKAHGKSAQIMRTPMQMLDVGLNSSKQTITLKYYLAERIRLMESRRSMSRIIRTGTILRKIERLRETKLTGEMTFEQVRNQNYNFRKKIIGYTEKILDAFVENHFIKSYTVGRDEKNAIVKFEICTNYD